MTWELVAAYGTAIADNAIWVVLAAGAAIAYVLVTSRREVALPAWAPRAVLALVIAFALAWAWQLRWLADDAFISFR